MAIRVDSSIIVSVVLMISVVLAVFCLVFMPALSSATEPIHSNIANNDQNIHKDGLLLFLNVLDRFLDISIGLRLQK